MVHQEYTMMAGVWSFASEDAGCAINLIDRDSNGRVDDR
jgi:hypothetical protein